jgi:DNA primase
MTAEDIAKVLSGRRSGTSWMARCPAHNDREPSLSIRQAEDGTVLVRCHAGCEQARVIAALRSRGLWIALLDLCRRLVAAGIEREERRERTALGGSVANLHALIASPRARWMMWGNEIPRERFEEAAE